MKSFTTKSNAKRAAKKIQAELNDRIESIDFHPTFKEDTGFGIYVVLTADNTREDWKSIQAMFPDAHIALREKKAPKATRTAAKTEGEKIIISTKSEVENPCQLVWDMADKMKGARRKDIIEACINAGVAYHTARTQYQRWFQAQKA